MYIYINVYIYTSGWGVLLMRRGEEQGAGGCCRLPRAVCLPREIVFLIDNLLVRIHFIIVVVRWTGLAPWEVSLPISYKDCLNSKRFNQYKLLHDCLNIVRRYYFV